MDRSSEASNNDQLVIRSLLETDVGQVAAIEQAIAVDPWSAELFAGEFQVPEASRHWLVAERSSATHDDPVVVAYGGLMLVVDEAHIMNLGVAVPAQRQGIARQLLSVLLLDALDRGVTKVTLEVRRSNAAAVGLYRGFGFEDAGSRPNYYPDGEDATMMWAKHIYRHDYVEMLRQLGR